LYIDNYKHNEDENSLHLISFFTKVKSYTDVTNIFVERDMQNSVLKVLLCRECTSVCGFINLHTSHFGFVEDGVKICLVFTVSQKSIT
jgi:hypothetical protein